MSSIDQQFVEYVVKSLVSKPDSVKVERRIDEKGVLLELTVDPDDLGRVIGKRGATAQSLRTLLRALGTKNDARYNLKIIDNGPPQEHRQSYGPQSRSRDDDQNDQRASATDKPAHELPEEPIAEEPSKPPEEVSTASEQSIDEASEEPQEEDHDDKISRTRQELKEFDDLDV